MLLIPLGGYPIVKTNINSSVSEDIIKFIKLQAKTKDPVTLFNLTNDAHILQNEKLKEIKKSIWSNFCNYIDNILEIENEFYLCNSWCTYQNKNNFHPTHSHPNAIFSSVYYLNTDKTVLQFTLPRSKIQEGFFFDYKIKNYNYFNSSTWSIPAEEGDLILFPGELAHQTTPYKGSKPRIIIGSSYFIQGELGLNKHYNSINIKNNHERYKNNATYT
tara:strand:+ start:49 stop:699 length:651 start_codon:yes stop_codon:yes gene_type:complete